MFSFDRVHHHDRLFTVVRVREMKIVLRGHPRTSTDVGVLRLIRKQPGPIRCVLYRRKGDKLTCRITPQELSSYLRAYCGEYQPV